jgi:hypothetical protein
MLDGTRRTTAGILACTALVVIAYTLGRCTAPPAAAEPAPIEFEAISWDTHAAAADALAHLAAFTSTRSAAAPTTVPAAPSSSGDRWDRLAACETGGRWDANTGNGFGGGLQFAHTATWSTWRAYGGDEFTTDPWDATREQQIVVAERVLADTGWKAWPGCAAKEGLL